MTETCAAAGSYASALRDVMREKQVESVNIEEEMEVERVNATAVESAVATTQQPVVVKKSRSGHKTEWERGIG